MHPPRPEGGLSSPPTALAVPERQQCTGDEQTAPQQEWRPAQDNMIMHKTGTNISGSVGIGRSDCRRGDASVVKANSLSARPHNIWCVSCKVFESDTGLTMIQAAA